MKRRNREAAIDAAIVLTSVLAFFVLCVLLDGCAHRGRPLLTVATPPDARLDRDRALVCGYEYAANRLACVTPEEFSIRRGVGQ